MKQQKKKQMPVKFDARKFMQLAVDEMNKSVAEPRADSKASPKVGAVVVTETGEVIGKAHRGELREGDHAEYTLLDRKLRDKNVTGCIMFATLEPCADGARKPPKIECAQRIVNARIKKVYVGIEDPDPTVAGKGIKFLASAGIEVVMFDKDKQDIIEQENKQFLKEATIRAQEAKKPRVIEESTMEKVIDSITVDEFSPVALKHYINRANLNLDPESPEFLALLERQELIRFEKAVGAPGFESQAEEYRRNDVMPFFAWQSSMSHSGAVDDKFKNNGERANVLSFHEFDDNQSFIQIKQGIVEKGQDWIITGRNKLGEVNSDLQGYHIEVFFRDRDNRLYRQEFFRKGSGRPTVNEPVLMKKLESTYKPTGLGILLFGKSPRTRFPQAVLKVAARYGNAEPEIQDFDDALVLIPDKVEAWLQKVLPSKISREKFARVTDYGYPIKVLREAIINALVHRDYEIEGAKCYLDIDDEKIVVKSPGLPVKPIKFEDFKEFKAPSLSRNPKLMAVFNAMNYVEERGIGMREMKSLPTEYQLPLPEITWEEPYLTITFPRSQSYFESVIGAAAFSQLNEDERQGLVYIHDQKEVSKAQYREHFGFNDKKAQRHLLKFKQLKLVKSKGQSTATRYYFSAG